MSKNSKLVNAKIQEKPGFVVSVMDKIETHKIQVGKCDDQLVLFSKRKLARLARRNNDNSWIVDKDR